MTNLLLAVLCFVGSHFLVSSTRLRAMLVGALGERLYLGFYSLAAIWLLIWAGFAYGRAPEVELWGHLPGLDALPLVVMPLALLLLVAGYTGRNPTAVMQAPVGPGWKAKGVLAITRHPLLWAIGLWAISHLAANGDLASLILFGGIAILAFGGTLAIDARKRRQWGERWAPFAAATSNLPFAAIAQGRARLKLAHLGWWRLALAAALLALLLWLHPIVIGVQAMPN
jgi:uncharacterized membrane protein